MVRVRWLLASVGFLSLFVALSGCNRQESVDELGTIVFEIPKVPGSNLPFTMPELGPRTPGMPPGKAPELPLPDSPGSKTSDDAHPTAG